VSHKTGETENITTEEFSRKDQEHLQHLTGLDIE